MSGVMLIYSTVGSREEALAIGRTLVEERLAACANVFDGMTSLYEWQGELREDREAVLMVKTSAARAKSAMARLTELHSYDCPAVLAWELAAVGDDYRRWIFTQTSPPASP